ncbi:MAG: hypothetical protein V1800_02020 [Candidatus Latescibacterota bacterium]
MNWVLQKWPQLASLFIYLALFLPVIAYNIMTVSVIVVCFLLATLLVILPGSLSESLMKRLERETSEDKRGKYRRYGFRFGRLVRLLQQELSDPLFPKRLVVIPLQRILYRQYRKMYTLVLESFFSGLAAESQGNQEQEIPKLKKGFLRKAFDSSKKSLLLVSLCILSLVLLAMISLPTIVLIVMIYRLFVPGKVDPPRVIAHILSML